MKYCKKCLYPDTKPDLYFNEDGICSACLAYEARQFKDWDEWLNKFSKIIIRGRKHSVYDCIVPVSGGKDSHYQVIKIRELGFNPLCVCARTDDITPIGRRNLDNIAKLGVDLIEVNVNNEIRKRIAKYALETVGDISWCEHVLIFTVPFHIACQYGIPTIIYGENPQNEYGAGPKGTESVLELGYEWLQEFGGLNGLRVDDIIDAGIALKKHLWQYIMPDGYALDIVEPKAYFMGQFIPWEGWMNATISHNNGFEYYEDGVEGTGGCNYENLDNYYTGIHDYFKYIKFGFGRATDLMCTSLRRGFVTRTHAKNIIIDFDGQSRKRYIGKYLYEILDDLEMSERDFIDCVRRFTNKDLFELNIGYPLPKFLQDLQNA